MKKNPVIQPRRRLSALTVTALILGTALAQAHPGHDLFQHGFSHAATTPDHLLILVLAGSALFGLGFLIRPRLQRRAIHLVGFLLAVGALVAWNAA
jgi:hypothetical protein